MRVFAISDIHVDYEENFKWFFNLSKYEYKEDVLILAGDVTDIDMLLDKIFSALSRSFYKVLYVPGNHDLWVHRNKFRDSFERFRHVKAVAGDFGVSIEPWHYKGLSVVPLLGWYDYSFGYPSQEILDAWVDYVACIWPGSFDEARLTEHFASMNEHSLDIKNDFVISFSHFLPRIDVMPGFIPASRRNIYPILGSILLEKQIRRLNPNIHIYGHSHVNRNVTLDGIKYINNAYGYPYESGITAKRLVCVHETNGF